MLVSGASTAGKVTGAATAVELADALELAHADGTTSGCPGGRDS